MSSIVLSGDTSGTITLDAPAVAGTNIITLPATTGTMTVMPSGFTLGAGDSSTFKNRLINGAMSIDQRNAGASQTIAAGAALAYTVDRWYAYSTGANVTGQRVAGTGITQFRYQFTGAASVTKIGFAQRIEQLNSYDLSNGVVTLSADLANSLLTTVTWTVSYANTANTFGTLASPSVTQIATGTFTVNSTITRYSTQITIPAAATTGLQVEFSVGAQTSGTWTIGNVQLEEGSLLSNFDYRPYGTELALCQRYLPAWNYLSGNDNIGIGYSFNTTQTAINISLPVTPRTIPSGVSTSAMTNFVLRNGSNTGGTPTSIATNVVSSGTNQNILITTTAGSPTLTAGQGAFLFANGSAQILFTGCEL